MRYTLLELTQRILESIRGEEVNSISDTAESLAVAGIIKEVYGTITGLVNLPENNTVFELTASGDSTKPTYMILPSDVIGINWIKYNKVLVGDTDPRFEDLIYLPLDNFFQMMYSMNSSDTEVIEYTLTTGASDTVTILGRNDIAPTYYTTFDDNKILFDSYDATVDNFLVKNKTLCFGPKENSWSMTNTFTPPLDSQQFDLLIQEAKVLANIELRQIVHSKAEQMAKRNLANIQRTKDRVNHNQQGYYYSQAPHFGRK